MSREQVLEAALVEIRDRSPTMTAMRNQARHALASRATPQTLDGATVEALRATPCPLMHAKGRSGCSVLFDAGGDSESAFCWARIARALSGRTDGPPEGARMLDAATVLGRACPHCGAPAGMPCAADGQVCMARIRAATDAAAPGATQGVSARPAREVAHEIFAGPHNWCTNSSYDPAFKRHSSDCDRTTKAIEAVESQLNEARAGRDAWIERAMAAERALATRTTKETP